MSDRIVIEQGSPTLAGLKPASMFSVFFDGTVRDFYREVRRINRILVPKGMRFVPLCIAGRRALMLLYREAQLQRELGQSEVQHILTGLGYDCRNVYEYISEISRRIRQEKAFPHEIGLFLGYPPADVLAFMQDRCACCKAVGCWKAYGNEEEAEAVFRRYRLCTQNYCWAYERGRTLSDLAVMTA